MIRIRYIKNVFISAITNPSAGALLVKSSKNTVATGYEIVYSTSSSFTQSTTKTVILTGVSNLSKTITGLKKGTIYFVKVRAYKTVAGYKFVSAYSAVKSLKIVK